MDDIFMQTIELTSGEQINIRINPETKIGSIWTDLTTCDNTPEERAGLDMLTGLLLGLAMDGVDLRPYRETIEQVIINFFAEVGE